MWKVQEIGGVGKLNVCSLAFVACFSCFAALADDEPFDIDSGSWMSSAHYQDVANGIALEAVPKEPDLVKSETKTLSTNQTSNPSVVALPTPAMPGLNKGFDVQVSSTEDSRRTEIAPIVAPDTKADINLLEKDWQAPSNAIKATKDDYENQGAKSLNVRMTFLPTQNTPLVSNLDPVSAQKLGHALMKKNLEINKTLSAKQPSPASSCVALDAYKKQQLDAIQSDRETLKALQDAIHSLGMSKQFDFTPGHNSVLNVSNSITPADEDLTTATNVR